MAGVTLLLRSCGRSNDGLGTGDPRAVLDPAVFRAGHNYQMDGKRLEDLSEAARRYELRDEEWEAQGSFVPLNAGIAEVAGRWRKDLRDPGQALEEGQGAALLATIAEHAVARSLDTPTRLVELVESGGDHWNDRPHDDFQAKIFFRLLLEDDLDSSWSNEELLARAWEGLRAHDHLFAEVGYGDRGAGILVMRAYSPAQVKTLGLSGKYSLDDAEYWKSIGYRYAMRFARPARTLDEVIQEHDSAVVAFAHVLVRLRDGRIGNWMTIWYLDPESERWVCEMMQASSSKTVMMVR